MKSLKIIIIIILSINVFSCSSSKTLKFTKKPDDILKTEPLSQFLEKHKNPKVVLRVNNATSIVTEENNVEYLYNAIENQLLSSGFVVRDRQLFNLIIGNHDNNLSYETVQNKSNTDIIIELTNLDPTVLYATNKYYDQKNKEKVEQYSTHERYGASIEFKVILIETNELAGIYKFNYTPCTNGCVIKKSSRDIIKARKRKLKNDVEAYEGVEKNEMEIFIKDATKKLVEEMRH